jgi:hypothetical protein
MSIYWIINMFYLVFDVFGLFIRYKQKGPNISGLLNFMMTLYPRFAEIKGYLNHYLLLGAAALAGSTSPIMFKYF